MTFTPEQMLAIINDPNMRQQLVQQLSLQFSPPDTSKPIPTETVGSLLPDVGPGPGQGAAIPQAGGTEGASTPGGINLDAARQVAKVFTPQTEIQPPVTIPGVSPRALQLPTSIASLGALFPR